MYGLAASGKVAVKTLVERLKDKSDFVRSAYVGVYIYVTL